MNFVADEGIERQIVDILREDGNKVIYIAELKPGIDDTEVLSYANKSDSLLVTADRDFGELVFRMKQVHKGIILTRLAGIAPDEKAKIVFEIIKKYNIELNDAFTVITKDTVRIRKRQK